MRRLMRRITMPSGGAIAESIGYALLILGAAMLHEVAGVLVAGAVMLNYGLGRGR